MNYKKIIIIFSCYLYSFLSLSIPVQEAKEILAISKSKFDNGYYDQALKKLLLIDIRKNLDNYDDIKTAYEIIIISYWQTNKLEKSKQAIKDLLLIDEKANLEAFTTPPALLEVFKEEQKKIQEKKIAISIIPLPSITSSKDHMGLFNTFLPLGANHYYLKNNNKALTYLVLQTSFLSINIGAFWWKQNYLRKNEYKQAFNTTQIIQFTSLAAFLLTYGISVSDAMVKYYN